MILHVVPRQSIFNSRVLEMFSGDRVYSYDRSVLGYIRLYIEIRKLKGVVIFHSVPQLFIFFSRFLNSYSYHVHFWGSDFYNYIVSEEVLENRRFILRELPIERARVEPDKKNMTFKIKQLIALRNINNAELVSGLNRFLIRHTRILIRKRIGEIRTRFKTSITYKPQRDTNLKIVSGDLKFIITHSATRHTFPLDTLKLLKLYADKWNIKVDALAFVSYGASNSQMERIASALKNEESDTLNVRIIRNFLSYDELDNIIGGYDCFISNAIRGEGLSMCEQALDLGCLAIFPKYSNNHLFLKEKKYKKVITLNEFLLVPPKTIRSARNSDDAPI